VNLTIYKPLLFLEKTAIYTLLFQ